MASRRMRLYARFFVVRLSRANGGCVGFIGQKNRKRAGRKPTSSYALIESQSVKTTLAFDKRGFNGGKKVKGRKQHIVTDTMGNLLSVTMHATNTHDIVAGINSAKKAFVKYPTIKKLCGD